MVKSETFENLKKTHKSIVLTGGNRRNRIKGLLGDNFVACRQRRGELELLTKEDIKLQIKDTIEKIWRREE